MNESEKERTDGLDWEYLGEVMKKKTALEGKQLTPMPSLMGQMFAVFAKTIIDAMGKDKGEAVIRDAVQTFGRTRGKRIAERVKSEGLELTFGNFLIYMDLDSSAALTFVPSLESGNMILNISRCAFTEGAKALGLEDYFHYYCRWVDNAILEGYNPDLVLEIPQTLSGGADACIFRYLIKR
jgi:hypothetical protein